MIVPVTQHADDQGGRIWSAIEEWATPIVSAFGRMMNLSSEDKQNIVRAYGTIFRPGPTSDEALQPTSEASIGLAASAMLCIYMLHRISGKGDKSSSFRDSEDWFLGGGIGSRFTLISDVIAHWPPNDALEAISGLRYDKALVSLFPYVLEVFQTLAVHHSRSLPRLKRSLSVFYTPRDITEYIATEVLEPWTSEVRGSSLSRPLCLDPACGSGAFLRAMLGLLAKRSAAEFPRINTLELLFGIDISSQAVQSCAFTLLVDCLSEVSGSRLVPWRVWQAIRANLAVFDSTRLLGIGRVENVSDRVHARSTLRYELLRTNVKSAIACHVTDNVAAPSHAEPWRYVGDLFPEANNGFSVVAGNPPYSTAGKRDGVAYLPFVELMWKLTRDEHSRAGLVVPLSIAYHSGERFRGIRASIMKTTGNWKFAFFDRTPDSLFGDDVKTRNCIMLLERSLSGSLSLATTGLLRWNSQNRSSLFSKIRFTSLSHSQIERTIPKIGSEIELEVYSALRLRNERLGDLWVDRREISTKHVVLFRPTAYNWLPVFRNLTSMMTATHTSSFRPLKFESSADADFVFAVLSSRLSYWLWRVEGDGFHLNEQFLASLPFHPSTPFPKESLVQIGLLSQELWDRIQEYPTEKVNAGVSAVSYRPFGSSDIIDRIDKILVDTYGLPSEFLVELRNFVRETIEAGRENSPRLRPILHQLATARA